MTVAETIAAEPSSEDDVTLSRQPGDRVETVERYVVRRHGGLVRATHWLNALCLLVLLMSGLQIFNAHPALYWGRQSDFAHPILAMKADDNDASKGVTTIGSHSFDTTGLFGVSSDDSGDATERGFPAWITLPATQDLATARVWHFFFAWILVFNGLLYMAGGFISRHLPRDLLPTRGDLRDIPHSIVEHAKLRFPQGDAARRYNVLQKITYALVVFLVLPVMILAGLAMSPSMDAFVPFLTSLFGGRQSARTIHFILAWSLVAFTLLHVVMVVLAGPLNELRSMITGRYAIRQRRGDHAA